MNNKIEYEEQLLSEGNALRAQLKRQQDDIHKGLEEVKILDAEKESLIKQAKKYKDEPLPADIRTLMNKSLEKIRQWNSNMKNLRNQSDVLKIQLDYNVASLRKLRESRAVSYSDN